MTRFHIRSAVCAGALVLALGCPEAVAQGRVQAAPPAALTDLDGTIESLVRTVDPSVVQIFTSGLTTSQGVITHGANTAISTSKANGAGLRVGVLSDSAEFIPNLKESRIVSRDGNRLVVEQKGRARRGAVSFAFENVRDVVLVPPREIRTRLVSGSMRAATSQTRLDRTDTGSRLTNHGEYTVSPLLPVSMVKDSIVLETREQFALLRAEVMRRHAKVTAAR